MRALAWVLLPLAGLIGGYLLFGGRAPAAYPEVVVSAPRILEREPDTIVRWRDRVVYRYVGPDQRATAPLGAADEVARFCAPTVLTRTDTVFVELDPQLLLRSVRYSESRLPWRADQLLVTGPLSTGDLLALDYPVRGSWDARTAGDSVQVRYPRGALAADLVETGLQLYGLIELVRAIIR